MKAKVRQLEAMTGSAGSFIKGEEHEVDVAEALRLQAAGIVEVLELPKPSPSRASKAGKGRADGGASKGTEGSEGGETAGAAEGEDGPGEPGGDSK